MKQTSIKGIVRKSSVVIGCLFLFSVSGNLSIANSGKVEPSVSPVPSPVEYTLPYPGLLPDNPLYFFKAVRDTMQHFFVSDALKKAEFYLLQADKSVSAGVMLTQRNETHELAGATVAESQRYFEKAIAEAEEAKKQGLSVDEIAKKLVLANEKHQETIKQLQGRVIEKHKTLLVNAGKHAQQLEKKAQQLLPDK